MQETEFFFALLGVVDVEVVVSLARRAVARSSPRPKA
jgi:hypothetical protein